MKKYKVFINFSQIVKAIDEDSAREAFFDEFYMTNDALENYVFAEEIKKKKLTIKHKSNARKK